MVGGMALQLSHPNAARRRASELPGMELRLESRALNEAIDATAQFFKTQRVVACCGDRFTLSCLCLAEPIRRAVVAAVARGLTNQNIGNSLGISVETVKTHVVNAKDKLGAADRTQLAVMALLYGLIDPLG